MISIPVDPVLEAQVADVLQKTGLTTEAAVRMLFIHLAEYGSMPAGLAPQVAPTSAVDEVDTIMFAERSREDR